MWSLDPGKYVQVKAIEIDSIIGTFEIPEKQFCDL